MPPDLSGTVRITEAGDSLGFRLLGADGTATIAGSSARYEDALPGVAVSYAAQPDGVKEEIERASRSAPGSFTFAVDLSPGLTATSRPDGRIEVSDERDTVRFELASPFMVDAAGKRSEAIGVDLAETAVGTLLKLTPDPAWVQNSMRRFPVLVDPTVYVKPRTGEAGQCHIWTPGQVSSFCGGGSPFFGFDGTRRSRLLLKFHELDNAIPASIDEILDAELRLHLKQSTTQNAAPIDLHRMTRDWDYPTWGSSGSAPWTPGGEFASPAATANESVAPVSAGSPGARPSSSRTGWPAPSRTRA